MANEFKIKHGFVSTGNGTVEGEIRVSGIAYAENGSRLATRAYLSQFLTDNNYVVTGDLPTNISAFTNDSGYLTEIIAHTHSAADITSGTLSNDRLSWNATDGFSGTYSLLWNASNALYTASWLQVRGSDDTLLTRNIVADGTVTGTNLMVSNWNAAHGWGDHDGLYDTAGTGAAEAGTVNTRIDEEVLPLIDTKQDAGNYLTAESDTLDSVTDRGNTTTNSITVNNITASRGNFGSTGSNPQISIFTENASASIADTFTDTTTDKSYIYFAAGTNSNDPGYIMHETSEDTSPDERNEGVLHLVPSDDNTGTDYVSIHGTNDPDAVRIYTSGLIQTSSSYQLQIQSGSGSVRILDDLSVQNTLYTDSHGNSSQWNTAYGWGNHASAGYLKSVPSEYLTQTEGDARYDGLGAANDVNDRIDNEVLPSIPTNNNELTNGAGYITDGNTGWNNTYGFITASASITGNAATATKLATARNIALSGAVTGNANFDGSGNITIATTATSDPTLTLAGDASGSATFTNLGNATLTVTVANDSHTHDTRYYTKSTSDSRFVNVTGDNVTGDLSVSGASLSVTSTADGSEAFFVDGVNGRLFTITDSLSDSLFSVNTISGLPVIEAFSDNTVKLGPFSNPVTIDSTGVLAIGGETAATQSYVTTAISNLVGGAPGALNTLNELAEAINDDASFASSVTSSLALKAPLASPALTGTPTAPTQATSNNSTRIATTAFVKAQGYVTTDTNYYLNGISKSGNTLTFSVNGATNRTYTFGSNAFTSYSNHVGLYDSAGTAASEAGAVNDRIDNEVLPIIQTPAITSNGSTPSLNTGISAAEIRSLIGAGTSSSDTNYYLSGASFNTNDGVLTLNVAGATDQTVDLDGRYLPTAGKAADSNLLDGINSTSFLRSDANDTATGVMSFNNVVNLNSAVNFNGVNGQNFTVNTDEQRIIWDFQRNGTRRMSFYHETNQETFNFAFQSGSNLQINGNRILTTADSSSFDAAGAADDVNLRIDNEVLPLIQTPAITSNGSTPSLNTGISAAEVRSLIGAQASGSYLTSYSETSTLDSVADRGRTTNQQLVSTNPAGFRVDSGSYARIELDSTDNWSYVRFMDTGVTTWDIACYNSGDLDFRPGGGGAGSMALTQGGDLKIAGDILFTADSATTSNQARMIDFTGFDKEGTTDFSDRAYIQHTESTGGHSGSVLVISSQNDSGDGIAFLTNASSKLKHNSNNIATENWVSGLGYISEGVADSRYQPIGSYLTTSGKAADANLLDGLDSSSFLRSNASDTFTGALTIDGYIKGNGQQLILSAGESHSYATGQTGEYIYLNAEQGLEINSETGNWSGGWAARKTAYLRGDQLTLDGETLTKTNIQNFKAAYNWGNHAGLYNTIIGTDSDINTSGSTIIDNIYVTDGVITSMGTRTLTAANLGIAKPAAPTFNAANIVGETIEVVFEQSGTSGVDAYQVWSSTNNGAYGLIANIPTQDIAATMTAIDAVFSVSGDQAYRVYAIKNGIYSDPAEGSVAYTASGLDVLNMSVVNLNTAYYIQYDMPASRFVDHIEIYMDAEASSGSLSRTGATLVYSGNNTNYMYQIAAADMNKFHQFWVEVIES